MHHGTRERLPGASAHEEEGREGERRRGSRAGSATSAGRRSARSGTAARPACRRSRPRQGRGRRALGRALRLADPLGDRRRSGADHRRQSRPERRGVVGVDDALREVEREQLDAGTSRRGRAAPARRRSPTRRAASASARRPSTASGTSQPAWSPRPLPKIRTGLSVALANGTTGGGAAASARLRGRVGWRWARA